MRGILLPLSVTYGKRNQGSCVLLDRGVVEPCHHFVKRCSAVCQLCLDSLETVLRKDQHP